MASYGGPVMEGSRTAIMRWLDRRHERRHERKVFTCDEHCGCDCVDRVLCRHDEFDTIAVVWCAHCGHPLHGWPGPVAVKNGRSTDV